MNAPQAWPRRVRKKSSSVARAASRSSSAAEMRAPRLPPSSTVSESESDVSGYSIVQAESRDAAAELFKDHPHLRMPADSSIELLEFLPLPGT